ncbi:MAG: hypothetical protein Q9169_006625 [Polycauliona sp. 2 TL-2023]
MSSFRDPSAIHLIYRSNLQHHRHDKHSPYTHSLTMTDTTTTASPPPPTPMSARATHLTQNLTSTLTRIRSSLPSTRTHPPRLVCVSKLKPASDILALHSPPSSHLHFGENYYQELLEKAEILPKGIRWHFIGALQTNKCRVLAERVAGLWCVESVDSGKKAGELDKGRGRLWDRLREEERGKDKDGEGEGEGKGGSGAGKEGDGDGGKERLRVFVQVNTSGEPEKSGVPPEETAALCQHIISNCERLRLQGLMTIGAIARSRGLEPGKENEDFICLKEVRDKVEKELGLKKGELELSMGMSEDFESAVRCGSDEVRVGSGIFGERPPKKDARVKDEVDEGRR